MRKGLWIAAGLTVVMVVCLVMTQNVANTNEVTSDSLVGTAPVGGQDEVKKNVPELSWAPVMFQDQIEAHPIAMADVPAAADSELPVKVARPLKHHRPELPISEERADELRRAALDLPPSTNVQILDNPIPTKMSLIPVNVDGPDMSQSCSGCATTPPDPELAVGPDHVVAVVNVAFAVYDKMGNLLPGHPKFFANFFAGVPGCGGEFDPNVLYDERADRFILGIDGGGTHYCIAASTTGDPTGTWNRYSFQTGSGSLFFDYPHAGVGRQAIYMGANIFNGPSFFEGRVWAITRRALYLGQPISVVSQSLGTESTPQPMNLHGFAQGTWPTTRTHYILTDDQFNGDTYSSWSWVNPFNGSGGTFTKVGVVSLNTATGVTAGFPINAPQQGGASIQANDWRVQDAEYRNGSVWMTNTISCNPGTGTVNCVRWAQLDPTIPAVVNVGGSPNAGVFAGGSGGSAHRIFADAAVNHCDTLLLGYTKTSTTTNPGVTVAARRASTPAGQLLGERNVITSSTVYSAFDPAPHRWGDYTGATPDPNGADLWYLGEYSKNISFSSGNWGTRIAKVSLGCPTP